MEDKKKLDEENVSPFAFPHSQQVFSYFHWSEARKKYGKVAGKLPEHSKKLLVGQDVFQEFIGPTAMTDIDPGYFTDLNGRPVIEKFSRISYVEQIRKVLKAKLTGGYYRDEVIRIDREFSMEKKKLADIEKNHQKYAKAFEEYLSNDHEKSLRILDEAQLEAKNTNDLITKRDQLSKDYGQVRLDVYQWEEMWRIAKACYIFVEKISPKPSRTLPSTTPSEIFAKSQKSLISADDEQASLESLIAAFEEDIKNLGPPDISLRDPKDLNQIFNYMELRNLDALIHLESLAAPIDEITANILSAEELVGKEINTIENNLRNLKAQIALSRERAVNLEKYVDYLIQKVFKELVCSESVLHLRVYIEDAYECCIGSNDANLDGYSMMKRIEKTYEKLNMTLDNLPHEIVRVCEKEGFTQEMREIKKAEDAAKKFELMHRLLAALQRIMEPTKLDRTIKPKFRSIVKRRRVEKPKSSLSTNQRKTRPLPFFSDKCESELLELLHKSSLEKNDKDESDLNKQVQQVNDENCDDCRVEMS